MKCCPSKQSSPLLVPSKRCPPPVLVDAVDVVGVQSRLVIRILLDHSEVVAIVYIDAVAGGNPDKSVGILVHLRHEIAR